MTVSLNARNITQKFLFLALVAYEKKRMVPLAAGTTSLGSSFDTFLPRLAFSIFGMPQLQSFIVIFISSSWSFVGGAII